MSLFVDLFSFIENLCLPAGVAVIGSDEANGAMQVYGIIPMNKAIHPGLCLRERSEGE